MELWVNKLIENKVEFNDMPFEPYLLENVQKMAVEKIESTLKYLLHNPLSGFEKIHANELLKMDKIDEYNQYLEKVELQRQSKIKHLETIRFHIQNWV